MIGVVGGITSEKEDLVRICDYLRPKEEKEKELHLETHKKKIIIIAGPTGCGKSALALKLAQAMGGEIISADSMQIYQGMDIGTAKASPQERELVAHHLIDIC